MIRLHIQKKNGVYRVVPDIEQLQQDLALSPSPPSSPTSNLTVNEQLPTSSTSRDLAVNEQLPTSNVMSSTSRDTNAQPSTSSGITYKQYSCLQCDQSFYTYSELISHRQDCYPRNIPLMEEYSNDIVRRHCAQSAHRGSARYIRFTPLHPPIQPIDFFHR